MVLCQNHKVHVNPAGHHVPLDVTVNVKEKHFDARTPVTLRDIIANLPHLNIL